MKLALQNHYSRKLMVISESDTVDSALKMMRNYSIHHLPVLDQSNEFVIGTLSDRELAGVTDLQASVGSVMVTPVKAFDVNTPLVSVVHAMIEEKVTAFLITELEEVTGIITTEDLLVAMQEMLEDTTEDDDDDKPTTLMDLVMNPVVQKTANMLSQAGI